MHPDDLSCSDWADLDDPETLDGDVLTPGKIADLRERQLRFERRARKRREARSPAACPVSKP